MVLGEAEEDEQLGAAIKRQRLGRLYLRGSHPLTCKAPPERRKSLIFRRSAEQPTDGQACAKKRVARHCSASGAARSVLEGRRYVHCPVSIIVLVGSGVRAR